MTDIKTRFIASCAAMALAAPAVAQGGARPTEGTSPSPANNSSPPSSPAEEQSNSTIAEIVVTANKRAENLQDVAATVTAVSQENLIRQGVKEIFDIQKVVPEVNISRNVLTNIAIRGIKTNSFGPTNDSPNAVHVDGVYISRFTSLQGLFFDAQRVEVLAGPQGTLYGRNSAGGTINLITNRPSQELGGYANIEYGNYNTINVTAAANVPIGETLAVRAAYYHNSHRGYNNNGTDDADQDSVRFSLLWKPTADDSLLLTADREIIRGRSVGNTVITEVLKSPTILANAAGAVSVVPAGTPGGVVVPILVSNGPRDVRTLVGDQDSNRQDTTGGGYMAQYDHDLGWANLTAQASYRRSNTDSVTGSFRNFPQDPRFVTASIIRPPALSEPISHAHWNTQELRLTSPSKRDFIWVIGAYRFYEKVFDAHNITYTQAYPNTSAATIGQIVLSSPLLVNNDVPNDLQTDSAYAAFGQATFTLADRLHLTGGLRYNYEKKHGVGRSIQNGREVPQAAFNLRRTDKKLTYKANISYEITSRNQIYVDHSSGFKSGGFAYGLSPVYNPENIKAYEIGTKNRFFGDRLQINASAWHYDYRDLTVNIVEFFFDTVLGRPNGQITTSNAKKLKVDGQSIAIEARPTNSDILTFNATHNNVRFTSFDLTARFAFQVNNGLAPGALLGPGGDFDYTGTPIGSVPKWAGNVTYDHIFKVLDGELDAQVAARYSGKQLNGNQQAKHNVNNYLFTDPYTTVDFSLRYKPAGSRWNVTGYVRNAFNVHGELGRNYVSNANFLATSDPRVTFAYKTASYAPPRTYGIIGSFEF